MLAGKQCSYYDPNTVQHEKPRHHKFIAEQIKQRATWRILAVINITRRARHMLGIPSTEPLGQFLHSNGTRSTLRYHQVTKVMRLACRMAYPDRNHYMRIHGSLESSHRSMLSQKQQSN
jgi:hypothetical protein